MAAFKRGPVYYLEPTIPGIGRLPRMSTGQGDQMVAKDMESALRTLANTGFRDIVLQLRASQVKLVEVWHAYLQGKDALERLRDRRKDPLLEDVVRERRGRVTDERTVTGYDQLLAYAPKAEERVAREWDRPVQEPLHLSWLLEPVHVSTLYEIAAEDRRKPNTVRRGLHRAVSDLLARRYSRGRMLAVMADVAKPAEDDSRTVHLTLEEVGNLLAACDDEFRPVLGLALTTGIDRAPLLAALARDYDEAAGTLLVRDTKTHARPRTLLLRESPVLDNAEYWLRQLTAGRAGDERMVPLTPRMLRDRFEAARAAIKRADLRWKDLRGVFASYYLLAGGQARDLQHILGHSTMVMTTRYLRRLPAGNLDSLRAGARKMGLPAGGTGLRAVAGGVA
jgi:integrase